jgi:Ca2+-binding EF-hand superfamily protein
MSSPTAEQISQFQEIDADGDGYITARELKESLQQTDGITPEQAEAIVRWADENGDRRIDLKEYAKLSRNDS